VGAPKHSHIVPRAHIALWARGGVVRVVFRDGTVRDLPPRHVGVRSGMYADRRLDGHLHLLEPAMAPLEDRAIRIIRRLPDGWPLDDQQRATLAEYLALLLGRSPGWRRQHDVMIELSRRSMREVNQRGASPEQVDATAEYMRTDAQRHRRMLEQLALSASLFGHMRWTLLSAPGRRFAFSDQPLVALDWNGGSIDPGRPLPANGLLHTIEMRLPLRPSLCLLGSWRPGPDDRRPHNLSRAHIAIVNSCTLAQADQHGILGPGQVPHVCDGPMPAIAPQLFPGYSAQAAHDAATRTAAAELLGSWLESGEDRSMMRFPSASTWERRAA
jgi:hypothetical protein